MSDINMTDYYDRRSHDNDAGTSPYNGKVLLAAVILLTVVIFFVILLHIYARWFLPPRRPDIAYAVSQPFQSFATLRARIDDMPFFSKGLDARAVASLPVFVHGLTKESESGSLECVVCLSVMEEGEIGRVLPKCKHVFHVECIDMWLKSHSTCPICRDRVTGEEASSMVDDAAAVHVVVAVVEDEVVVRDESRVDEDQMNNGSSSLSSLPSCTVSSSSPSCSSSSSSSSLGCSLKRIVSKSRSESRVFPSVLKLDNA